MIRSVKIRLFPTEQQEELLWKHIHASRYVWNWGLSYQMNLFKNGEKKLSSYSLNKVLTQHKKENEWLNEISSKTLSQSILDLDDAYKRFFNTQKTSGKKYSDKKVRKSILKNKKLTPYDMMGHPKFKSKSNAKSKFYSRHDAVYFKDNKVNLEKIGKVSYNSNYTFQEGRRVMKFSNPRISYNNNKWMLSFGIEYECKEIELSNESLGIDVGIKELAFCSDGSSYGNINKTKRVKRLEKQIKKYQRKISRKYHKNESYDKTHNVIKLEKYTKELQNKLSNIRQDYTHKCSRDIVNKKPYKIVVEDLNISGMMKNRHLSKAIQQQNLYKFIRQIEYKSEEYGIEFKKADRWYPSSKTCSECGCIKKDLKLSDRVYECNECGTVIDRDLNASINLSRVV
jgi:putative transposase